MYGRYFYNSFDKPEKFVQLLYRGIHEKGAGDVVPAVCLLRDIDRKCI